jgi:hypothetical protein
MDRASLAAELGASEFVISAIVTAVSAFCNEMSMNSKILSEAVRS